MRNLIILAPDTLLAWYRLAGQLTLPLLFPGTLNSPLMFSLAVGNPLETNVNAYLNFI